MWIQKILFPWYPPCPSALKFSCPSSTGIPETRENGFNRDTLFKADCYKVSPSEYWLPVKLCIFLICCRGMILSLQLSKALIYECTRTSLRDILLLFYFSRHILFDFILFSLGSLFCSWSPKQNQEWVSLKQITVWLITPTKYVIIIVTYYWLRFLSCLVL